MLYFAYASNLDPVQFRARCPAHEVVGLAVLADHRLVFPRFSGDWGGGVASVALAHGGKVWGVVYELSDPDLAALDTYEGWRAVGDQHNHYDRETVTVELVRPDDASVPRRLRVLTYIARISNPSAPSRRYLETILRGARHHRLPEDYVERLGKTEVREEDPASAAGE
jgi:cation transport regulator ChaC